MSHYAAWIKKMAGQALLVIVLINHPYGLG